MRKIGISNYQLPTRKEPGPPIIDLMPYEALVELSSIATEKVVKMTLRAVSRAELFEARHPLWNSFARCYTGILSKFDAINKRFPGVTRVIHNDEILPGDILVSDFSLGLNFGSMDGKTVPLKVRVRDVSGDLVTGTVLDGDDHVPGEVCSFKNEIWFFVSHKFGVIPGGRKKLRTVS